MTESVIDCLKKVLKEKMEVLSPEFSYDSDLRTVGLNSMNYVELVLVLEDKFDITIDDDDLSLENFSTINKLVNYIEKKQMS